MKKWLVLLSISLVGSLTQAQHIKPLFNTMPNYPKGGWYGDVSAHMLFDKDIAQRVNGDGAVDQLKNPKGKTGFGIGFGRFNYFIGGIIVDYIDYGFQYAFQKAEGELSLNATPEGEMSQALKWMNHEARLNVTLGKIIQPGNYWFILPQVKLSGAYSVAAGDSLGSVWLQESTEKSNFNLRAAAGLGIAYKFNSEWFVMPYALYHFWRAQDQIITGYDQISNGWTPLEVGLKFMWHKPSSKVACDIPELKVDLKKAKRRRKKGAKLF